MALQKRCCWAARLCSFCHERWTHTPIDVCIPCQADRGWKFWLALDQDLYLPGIRCFVNGHVMDRTFVDGLEHRHCVVCGMGIEEVA